MIDTYGNVDLGTLDWNKEGLNFYTISISNNIKKPKDDNTIANIYCNLYRAVPLSAPFVEGDMAVNTHGYLYIRNTRYTTTAEFKEAMRGQILRYELEIPANGGYLPMYKGRYKVSNVCQLFIPADTHTSAGVTITNNGDGSLTIDGTGTGSGTYTNFTVLGKNNMPYKISDKLFISAYVISGTCSFLFAGFSQSGNPSIILENPAEGTYYSGNISKQDKYESNEFLGFYIGNNTFNNLRVNFNIIDLTEMYGAGNEPTTVEQFRQDFPNDLYPYSPYCWVNMKQLSYKVSDVCQLLDKSKYPGVITNAGVTTTSNGDGSITINGTSTKSTYINCTPAYPKENNGHVFYICANNTTMSKSTWQYGLLNQIGTLDYGNGVIKKTNNGFGRATGITFNEGVVFDNVIIKPQIIDLTEMYGAGNEPTTVAEFKQKFPDELYPYSPKCYLPLK